MNWPLSWGMAGLAALGISAGCGGPGAVHQGSVGGADAAWTGDTLATGEVPGSDSVADAPWPAVDTLPSLADACVSSDAASAAPESCAGVPPPWLEGKPVPAPTLKLDLGNWDAASGTFTPWTAGQWAPMHLGMRAGFGVWTVLAVRLPAGTADPVKLHVTADALAGCEVVGSTVTSVMSFHQVPGDETLWVNADSLSPGGACVLIGGGNPTKPWDYCGQWLTVSAQVGTKDGVSWGEVKRVVRLYGFRNSP